MIVHRHHQRGLNTLSRESVASLTHGHVMSRELFYVLYGSLDHVMGKLDMKNLSHFTHVRSAQTTHTLAQPNTLGQTHRRSLA